MTKHTLDNLAGDPPANPAARALELLDGPRPRSWKWDEDGPDVAGTLEGTRRMADRFREGESVLVLELQLVDEPERVLVYCSRPLERMIAGHSPRRGDGIAIRRGDLVDREGGRAFRRWTVEVVPQDGAPIATRGEPGPDEGGEPWHLEDL